MPTVDTTQLFCTDADLERLDGAIAGELLSVNRRVLECNSSGGPPPIASVADNTVLNAGKRIRV